MVMQKLGECHHGQGHSQSSSTQPPLQIAADININDDDKINNSVSSGVDRISSSHNVDSKRGNVPGEASLQIQSRLQQTNNDVTNTSNVSTSDSGIGAATPPTKPIPINKPQSATNHELRGKNNGASSKSPPLEDNVKQLFSGDRNLAKSSKQVSNKVQTINVSPPNSASLSSSLPLTLDSKDESDLKAKNTIITLSEPTRNQPHYDTALNPNNHYTDDEARIQHAARHRPHQASASFGLANSSPSDHIDGDATALSMANILDSQNLRGAQESPSDQIGSAPRDSPLASVNARPIRSALKKTTNGGNKAVDSLDNKSPKLNKRNVSFNQTVIVFCEEIETPSPSETFEPPAGYQDAPLNREDHHNDDLRGGASTRDRKAHSVTYGMHNDDFDLLSKIVGDDASNLTDEELFGLLESGSLLRNFEIGDHEDNAFTLERLNSDRSFLCQDAISDSDSESCPVYGATLFRNDGTSFPIVPELKPKATKVSDLKINSTASTAKQTPSSKNDQENSSDRNDSHSTDCVSTGARLESQSGQAPYTQSRSMPARVKVSTKVDSNHHKRAHQAPALPVKQDDSHQQTRIAQNQVGTRQKVLPNSSNQNLNIPNSLPSNKQQNADPLATSRPLIIRSNIAEIDSQRKQVQYRPSDNNCYQANTNAANLTGTAPNAEDRPDSRDNRQKHLSVNQQQTQTQKPQQQIEPTLQQYKAPLSHIPNQQSAQITQSGSACHICRAIESKRHQASGIVAPREVASARTSLMASNHNVPQHSETVTNEQCQQQRPILTVPTTYVPNHRHHLRDLNRAPAVELQPQQLKQPQIAPTSQPSPSSSSCVSCREMTLQQQHRNYPSQPNNPSGQPIVRPIACQLVYVVDQHGNRMKALQLVGNAQVGINQASNQQPRLMLAPNNCRFPNLTSTTNQQNLVCLSDSDGSSNPGVVRNIVPVGKPALVRLENAQSVNTDQGLRLLPSNSQQQQQQQRMQVVGNAVPKNHTVYYVRQPLGAQNFRQSLGTLSNSVTRSFPDAHEIRRLDGIRGPTDSPSLAMHCGGHPHVGHSSGQSHSMSSGQLARSDATLHHISDDGTRMLRLKRDESSDDPTFGFSQRPTVKVVTSSTTRGGETRMMTLDAGGSSYTNETAAGLDNRSRILPGSHTLDRKNLHREQPQREQTKENSIPSTSSMSNINKTLVDFRGPVTNHHQPGHELGASATKEMRQYPTESQVGAGSNQALDRYPHSNVREPQQLSRVKQARQDRKDKPEVAYVMEI